VVKDQQVTTSAMEWTSKLTRIKHTDNICDIHGVKNAYYNLLGNQPSSGLNCSTLKMKMPYNNTTYQISMSQPRI
jgi:hypothetical protein